MWKTIPGLSPYEAHPDGRIRNGRTGKVLTPQDNGRGYLALRIRNKTRRVHRLIALTFLPCDNPDAYDVDHIDYNKHNNAVANLRYLPKLQNAARQARTREETLRKYFILD